MEMVLALIIFTIILNILGTVLGTSLIIKEGSMFGLFLVFFNGGLLAWNIVRLLDKLNLIEHLNSV